jgi:hypothetical protein
MASVVERLPSQHKALSSSPSTAKKKRKECKLTKCLVSQADGKAQQLYLATALGSVLCSAFYCNMKGG